MVGEQSLQSAESESGAQSLPQFPFQLADVYVMEASVTRREARPDDPEQPAFVSRLQTTDSEDGDGFLAFLIVEATFRIRESAVCAVSASTTGAFIRSNPADAEVEARFRSADCAVLLWPYARAHIGELVRMTGLSLPPLPTIDVRTVLQELAPRPTPS